MTLVCVKLTDKTSQHGCPLHMVTVVPDKNGAESQLSLDSDKLLLKSLLLSPTLTVGLSLLGKPDARDQILRPTGRGENQLLKAVL